MLLIGCTIFPVGDIEVNAQTTFSTIVSLCIGHYMRHFVFLFFFQYAEVEENGIISGSFGF
jgi:hypothetical protein